MGDGRRRDLSPRLQSFRSQSGCICRSRTWHPVAAQKLSEDERLVQQLAERLRQRPDDARGWRLLGGAYVALGHYAEGQDAYREAWKRTPNPDNELKLEFAESLVLADRSALSGEAAALVEEVLSAEPNNPKALWYGGLVSLDGGREAEVRDRWSRLLQMNPPAQVVDAIHRQLASLGGAQTMASTTGPQIAIDVRLGEGRSLAALGPQAMLFLFARAPGGGPPVAVKRLPVSSVPGKFTLSDADSMIPGRSLGDFDELTVMARLSATGQPIERTGDWYAEAQVRPNEGATVALVIDQVVQ